MSDSLASFIPSVRKFAVLYNFGETASHPGILSAPDGGSRVRLRHGNIALIHAPYVKHIRAIDLSPKMIEIARGKARGKNINNVTFEVSSIDELSVAERSLDAVLGLSISHFLAALTAIHPRKWANLR